MLGAAMKRAQTYTAPGITVTFDPNLCIHSAVCLRTLPMVFDVRRRRWIAPEADTPERVAAAVRKCPTGALQCVLEGAAETADDAPAPPGATIVASLNGPLLVEGDFQVLDERADPIGPSGRVALCRCGGTGNAPFCDGTHRVNGFLPKKTESGNTR